MITTSVGLFDSFSQVVRAVKILQGCGFSRDEISVVARKSETGGIFQNTASRSSNPVDKRKLTLPADLDNFAIDAPSLFIRGIGWSAIAGPLAFILVEATDETQFGDLDDALIAFDVVDEEAKFYAEGVRRGGTLLAVTAANHLSERAEDVMLLHGAVDMQKRTLRWQQQGWYSFSPTAEPYTAEEIAIERQQQAEEHRPGREWSPYDRDFRNHFYLTYSDGDLPYDLYAPAYRYGYQLASDERYDKKDWSEIEAQVRQAWERQHETIWMTVADAVSYGFLKGRENAKYRARY